MIAIFLDIMHNRSHIVATQTTTKPKVQPSPHYVSLDLSMYGFPYKQDSADQDGVGWVNWHPDADDGRTSEFTVVDGGNSIETCQESLAPSCDWSDTYETCWCYWIDLNRRCTESCVQENYVDFSTLPMSELEHCEKSNCDEEWYYDRKYCNASVGYNKDECDAKIAQNFNSPVGPKVQLRPFKKQPGSQA